MTKTEIILTLALALAATWSGIVTVYARSQIRKHKAKVDYYQQPETQVAIAHHVIKNRWFKDGEVFR